MSIPFDRQSMIHLQAGALSPHFYGYRFLFLQQKSLQICHNRATVFLVCQESLLIFQGSYCRQASATLCNQNLPTILLISLYCPKEHNLIFPATFHSVSALGFTVPLIACFDSAKSLSAWWMPQ